MSRRLPLPGKVALSLGAVLLVAFAAWQRLSLPFAATVAWLAGLSCFWLAAGSGERVGIATTARPPVGPPLPPATEHVLLVMVLVIAVALRFVLLSQVPPLLVNDEAMFLRETSWRPGTLTYFGEDLAESWPRGWFPYLFGMGWNGFAGLSYFVHWLPVTVLGFSNWSLRCGSALIGVLSIGVVYLWARRWWGALVGLGAAFALSVNIEHIFWSRIALNNIDAVFVGACALAALAWALDTRRSQAWVALGYALGGGFYTYHGAKLHVLLAILVLLVLAATRIERWSRRDIAGVFTAVLAAMLVITPLVPDILAQWPAWYAQHAGRVRVDVLTDALGRGDLAAVWMYVRGTVGLSARLMRPAPVMSALILAGAVIAVWKWKDSRYLAALIWVLSIFVVASMTTGWRSARLIGAAPVVGLLAGLAIAHLYAFAHRRLRSRGRRGVACLVGLLSVVLAYEALWVEFVWRAQFRNETFGFCQVIGRVPPPVTFLIVGTPAMLAPEDMLPVCALLPHPQRRFVRLADDADVPELGDPPEVVAFVFPDRRHRLKEIMKLYPEAAPEPYVINGADPYAGWVPGLEHLGARRGKVSFHVAHLRSAAPVVRLLPPAEVCSRCRDWFGLSTVETSTREGRAAVRRSPTAVRNHPVLSRSRPSAPSDAP